MIPVLLLSVLFRTVLPVRLFILVRLVSLDLLLLEIVRLVLLHVQHLSRIVSSVLVELVRFVKLIMFLMEEVVFYLVRRLLTAWLASLLDFVHRVLTDMCLQLIMLPVNKSVKSEDVRSVHHQVHLPASHVQVDMLLTMMGETQNVQKIVDKARWIQEVEVQTAKPVTW